MQQQQQPPPIVQFSITRKYVNKNTIVEMGRLCKVLKWKELVVNPLKKIGLVPTGKK